jgi:tetratricopeptide (TPR) repeat protein
MKAIPLIGCLAAGLFPAMAALAESPAVPSHEGVELPFPEPPAPPAELSPEAIYSFLVGEIAADRGQFALALNHYAHSATLSQDPYAAERATRMALSGNDQEAAVTAARRWVELAPNAVTARQALAHALLRRKDAAGAREQLEAILAIAAARDEDEFLLVGAVLGSGHAGELGSVLMRELVDARPDDARGHYALAMMLAAAKSYAEAEAHARRAIELEPGWQKPRMLKIQILAAGGRQAEAREALKDAVVQRPDDVALRNAYAALLVQAKDYTAALAEYRVLRQAAPTDADTLFAAALVAMEAKAWDEAREALQALLTTGERNDEARYFLAQTEDLAGQTELALALFTAIDSGPYRIDAAMRRAGLMGRRGEPQAALDLLRGLRSAEPSRSADLYLAEAEILQKHAELGDAATVYAEAIAAHPDDLQLYYARGLRASQMGRVDEAEADFKHILDKEPDHADALNALGYTLADLTDRHLEALGYVERALRLKPDNAAFLDSMGWVQYRQGNHAAALDHLRRAAAMIDDAEVAAHLGEVLWVTGAHEEARQVWDKALAAEPDNGYLRRTVERLTR